MKIRVLLLLVFGLIMAGLLIWLAGRESSTPVRRLPDGSELVLKRVSFGEERSVYVYGGFREKLFYHLLPPALRKPLPPGTLSPARRMNFFEKIRMRANRTVAAMYPGTNGLGVFMIHRYPSPSLARSELFRIVAVGPTGEELAAPHDLWGSTLIRLNPKENLVGWALPVFARRERTVHLRFYTFQNNHWEPITELTFSNPARRKYAVWTPEPLPITRRQEGIEFSLLELATGLNSTRLNTPAQPSEPGRILTRLKITENGQPTSAWEIDTFTIVDATGNQWNVFKAPAHWKRAASTLPSFYQEKPGEKSFLTPGALSTNETVKLQVSFWRRTDFALEELWEVKAVPLPEAGQTLPLHEKNSRHGFSLELQSIKGSTWVPPENPAVPPATNATIQVLVSTPQQIPAGWRLALVRAIDEQGKDFVSDWLDARFGREVSLRFFYPPGVRKADLTFALYKSAEAQFLARPVQFVGKP